MNFEPMRTISFDGETVYTVPRPVEATPEMTQPVGVDDEGRLFTEPGGGGGGTSDHSQLSNRDAADQHPVSAITGLQTALNGKQDTLTAGSGISIVNNIISATGGGGGGVSSGLITDMQEILRSVAYYSADVSSLIAGLSQYVGRGGDTPSTGRPVSVGYSGTTATVNNLKSLDVSYSGTTATIGA